jgi:hypothetical protein
VIAHHRPCLRVALSVGVYDVAGIAVLGLPTRVKDLLPDWRSALVGWLSHRTARVDGRLLALSTTVVSRTALLAYAGCRAFGLLHDRLLDEGLALRGRLRASGVEGAGMARNSVAAVMSF